VTVRRVVAALAAACLALPASATNPAKVAVTPASPDAVLIVRTPPLGVLYTLAISRYDPDKQDLAGDWVAMPVQAQDRRDSDFLVEKVKPGTYAIQQFVQQARWGVCFHAGTLQFDVKAGEAVYLGQFDAATPLAELQRRALDAKDLYAGGFTVHNYFDGITPPKFTQPDDPALPEVRAFIAREMPKTKVAPVRARFRPATFRAGRALVGSQRVCGGSWSRKDKG